MIHWLTQSHVELPDLTETQENGRYLNDEELAHLQTLKTDKRRKDWLLGRWTAKRLLQKLLWEQSSFALPLDMITITNNVDGVPDYCLPNGAHPFSISISHGHGHAFVAAIEQPNVYVGADMERIEARPLGFMETYFTKEERERVAYCIVRSKVSRQNDIRNTLITAVWSAKEAALKALHLGLSVDTRVVHCLFDPFAQMPDRWLPFTIRCEHGRLPKPAPPLMGWWRVEDDFVLTIAVGNI